MSSYEKELKIFGFIRHIFHIEKRNYAIRKYLFMEVIEYVYKSANQKLLVWQVVHNSLLAPWFLLEIKVFKVKNCNVHVIEASRSHKGNILECKECSMPRFLNYKSMWIYNFFVFIFLNFETELKWCFTLYTLTFENTSLLF